MRDYCGMPGLVWYSEVADLEVGQWLDTLDHRGARAIYSIDPSAADSPVSVVRFDGIRYGILEDSEIVRKDVTYDVVNPDSMVAPDGSPL